MRLDANQICYYRLMKSRIVVVNDKMQKDYSYELVASPGKEFDQEFMPELTPAEMLELGVFGGRYMRDCGDEFPKDWFASAKFAIDASDPS
jgi:hypothetical protein